MLEVDPRFRQMGQTARKSRNRSRALRGGILGGALIGLMALGWIIADPDLSQLPGWPTRDAQAQLTQVEESFDLAPPVTVDSFSNIPGDPLIIPPLEPSEQTAEQQRPVPPALARSPFGRGLQGPLSVLHTALFQRDQALMAPLPATREDFALFQAERSRAGLPGAPPQGLTITPDQRPVSSVAFSRPANERRRIWGEKLVGITLATDLSEVLQNHGLSPTEAQRVTARMDQITPEATHLAAGSVLALRTRDWTGTAQVIQLSLYGTDGYVGSLALSGAGQLVPSADAWADQPLTRKGEADTDGGQRRLLDVIYAAALRDDVPPELIGQALALMAGLHDLDSFADPDDQLTLIFNRDDHRPEGGRILFIGVTGPSGDKPCYVITNAQHEPECVARNIRRGNRAGLRLRPPVSGVMTRKFTPPDANRTDPNRGTVAWSAPQGSPVLAAGPGVVTTFRVDPVFGAELTLTHPGGEVSHYTGMAAIAGGLSQGSTITEGAPIGTVGTPRGREEPGVTYRLEINGQATNPLPYMTGGGEVLASDSVEALVVQIIQVESAGNARAQNPLSSAAGLGQFIKSTWLRMMRSYRPDLVASLSRQELLDLRFDPDLSREMVRHLAQENEAFLRRHGHAITPGRLYLAHFLGPGGADKALSADPGRSVSEVMGAAVVKANPFLKGYSIANLEAWAERKMRHRRHTPQALPPAPVSLPPPVMDYIQILDDIAEPA